MPEEKSKNNPMKEIYIDKVVVNIGVGEGGAELEKSAKILELVTKKHVVKTICKVKLPTWGIRPGLPIGCKTTLRGKEAIDFITLTLKAKRNKLKAKSFTKEGNFSYGIHEYLDVPGIKYDPELGIRGFDVCINLRRRGYRIKLRKYNQQKLGKKQIVSKNEAIDFIKQKFGVVVE
ncbi:50S ribosomal protein L5 [bacterium]|nr:50S ribosomal protein L5 [Candidatus ainarchaeum sp.]MDD3975759.1 50S ribosomal protein L5 [Candidatus ainarchaeum sp.]NCC71561.1 50S ribosomal protein L5 [bacterium]